MNGVIIQVPDVRQFFLCLDSYFPPLRADNRR